MDMCNVSLTPSNVTGLYSAKDKLTSFFHLNAQSARNKHDELYTLFTCFGFSYDVIMLTETWYQDEYDILSLPGYRTYYLNRPVKQGGGVLLMMKDLFDGDVYQHYTRSDPDFEILTVISSKNVFAVLYRPPTGCTSTFFEFLDEFFSWANDNAYNIILGGDLNINMLHESVTQREFVTLLESNGCSNLIAAPTRIQNGSATLLDLFITNLNPHNTTSGVIGAQISDHLPIFLFTESTDKHKRFKNREPVTIQDVNPLTLEEFQKELLQTDWGAVYEQSDPDEAYSVFLTLFKSCYNKCFKNKQVHSKKSRKPWITKSMLKLIKQKDALYRKFLQTRELDDLLTFKRFRNKVTAVLRQAKKHYLHNVFNIEVVKRTDILWKRLNILLGRTSMSQNHVPEITVDGVLRSGTSLANSFNSFFTSIADSLHDSRSLNYLRGTNCDSAFLKPTSADEIQNTFLMFRNSRSRDCDGIQIGPVKYVIHIVAPLLEYIYNLCFARGKFPHAMQLAVVSVIFKGGDNKEMSNYRPICILPVFSKGIEKLITDRMTAFCDKHNILTNSQFGFRKGRSTELALLSQKELILKAIENKLLVLAIFVDFSKAFNSINHQTLIKKLEYYGFRGIFLDLLKTYLEFRRQKVVINTYTSTTMEINSGIPQGSILGPLLFNLYINDITTIDDSVKFIVYADDSSLFFTSSNTNELVSRCNHVLSKLHEWSTLNSLTINSTKTKAMLFQAKNKNAILSDDLIIGTSKIELVSCTKSLGVIFDTHLTWNNHIEFISKKVAKAVGVLTRLRFFLPPAVKVLIYNSLFLSHINYCHLVWGTTSASNVTKLLLLQKKAVRAIANAPRLAHTEPLFSSLHITPMNSVYNGLLFKRYLGSKKQSHNILLEISNLTKNTNDYNTRHNETWYIPKMRTNYGSQSLSYRLPSLLNSLDNVM